LAHVTLAVQGTGWDNPDNIPLMVANQLIGSWDRLQASGPHSASYLAEVSSKTGCSHTFQAFNTNYTDTGLWLVAAT
jgi:processing peptidase subunit beta